MSGLNWLGAVLLGLGLVVRLEAANTAASVVGYHPGTGYATDWLTGAGYTNAAAALGLPTSSNADGPVTPFNAPYTGGELVSIGTGGWLTVRFAEPVINDPGNRFGLDFLVYGSTAFVDVAWPNGLTDGSGSTFGSNGGGSPGATRVWVSMDDLVYYELQGAPVLDSLFPTDSAGVPGQPIDPAWRDPILFANKTLAEIRAIYGDSAGGTGFDLDWAVDTGGDPVALSQINFVRLEVLQDRSEIDALVAVPEPSVLGLAACGLAGLVCSMRRRRG